MAMLSDTVSYLEQRIPDKPEAAIVLGSGLKRLADVITDRLVVPYADIPGFPEPSVQGHTGSLVFGRLAGRYVVCQLGRFHFYEGWDAETVVLPVRVFGELGIPYLIVTNAAGGLNRTVQPPQLLLISDHMNMMFRSPLAGAVLESETRFPDMSEPYDRDLQALALLCARGSRINLQPGVYVGVSGPSYETPAEIRMLERLGADAVGMSTVPEVITARARGIRVLGISTITNVAAGMSTTTLSHEDVLTAGQEASAMLTTLVSGVVGRLPAPGQN